MMKKLKEFVSYGFLKYCNFVNQYLAMLPGMQDISSSTRDQTQALGS